MKMISRNALSFLDIKFKHNLAGNDDSTDREQNAENIA
jgi:hypothetical protein